MRIRLSSEWTKYAGQLAGFQMLGVVFHENGDAGALARSTAGIHVQVNGARIQQLDQNAVALELERLQGARKRTNVLPFARKPP